MNLLVIVLGLLRSVFPLPAFRDKDAVLEWLHRLESPAAELIAVVKIDGRSVGDGRPGPITLDLMKRFRELTHRQAS